MDRVHQRIARDISVVYKVMTTKIPSPLVKVFALEGLMRSDPKYKSMITM